MTSSVTGGAVAEEFVRALLAVLHLQRAAIRSAMLSLHFVCLEEEVSAVRGNEIGRRAFPHLFTQYDVHEIGSVTGAAMAYNTARCVWEVWEGIATGDRPSALGGTVHDAFVQLGRVFIRGDIPLLMTVLQVEATKGSDVVSLLQAAIRNNIIGCYNVRELRIGVVQNSAVPVCRRLEALDVCWNGGKGAMNGIGDEKSYMTCSSSRLQSMMARTFAEVNEAVHDRRALSNPGTELRTRNSLASSGSAASPSCGISVEQVVLQAGAFPPQPPSTCMLGVQDAEQAAQKLKPVLTSSAGAARSVGPRIVAVGLGGSDNSDTCKGVAVDPGVCTRFCNRVIWIRLSRIADETTVANAIPVLVASLLRSDDATQRRAVESLLPSNDFDDLSHKAQLHISNAFSGMHDFARRLHRGRVGI